MAFDHIAIDAFISVMQHSDIKPSNIMLDFDDRAVLIDFGLSRRLGIAGPVALGDLFDLSGEGRLGSGAKLHFPRFHCRWQYVERILLFATVHGRYTCLYCS